MPRDQVFEEDEEYEAKLRKKRKQENEDGESVSLFTYFVDDFTGVGLKPVTRAG